MLDENSLKKSLEVVLETGKSIDLALPAEEEKISEILLQYGWKQIAERKPDKKEPRSVMNAYSSCKVFYNSTIKKRYAFLGIPGQYTQINGYKTGMLWLSVLGGERIQKIKKNKKKDTTL